jgi:hypothetical protein
MVYCKGVDYQGEGGREGRKDREALIDTTEGPLELARENM